MKKKNLIIIVVIALFAMSLFAGYAKNDTIIPTPTPEITQTPPLYRMKLPKQYPPQPH